MPWISPVVGVVDHLGKFFCPSHVHHAQEPACSVYADNSAFHDASCDGPGCEARFVVGANPKADAMVENPARLRRWIRCGAVIHDFTHPVKA